MIVAKIKKNVEGKKDLMNYFIIVVREKNKNREKSNKRSGNLQYNPPRSTCAGLAKRRCGGAENEISMKNHITYPVLRRRFCCADLQIFLSPKATPSARGRGISSVGNVLRTCRGIMRTST